MKRLWLAVSCALVVLAAAACAAQAAPEASATPAPTATATPESTATPEPTAEPSETEEEEEMKLTVEVGGSRFTATLEQNAAVDAFVEMLRTAPVTIEMRDYAGFEKVGALGTALPTENQQTTTAAGDIVLYNSDQIVMFYGANSWSYTRLAKIDDRTGWEEALGSGDVTAVFSID